jgi:uncharacterized membrane protein
MKRILLIALFIVQPAFAAPFVTADVVAGVASCGVYLDTNAKVTVPVTGTTCRYDLAGLPAGSHVVKMTAITVADPLWGTQESAESAPLPFVKPGAPAAPSGLTLTP